MSEPNTHRFCGRDFSPLETETIRRLIADNPKANRAQLSRLVCQELNWLKPDGLLKEMSCRVAMIRMQDRGLIDLPVPTKTNGNGKRYRRRTPEAEPELFTINSSVGKLTDLRLDPYAKETQFTPNCRQRQISYPAMGPIAQLSLQAFGNDGPHPAQRLEKPIWVSPGDGRDVRGNPSLLWNLLQSRELDSTR